VDLETSGFAIGDDGGFRVLTDGIKKSTTEVCGAQEQIALRLIALL
jgi:hypothetical protein